MLHIFRHHVFWDHYAISNDDSASILFIVTLPRGFNVYSFNFWLPLLQNFWIHLVQQVRIQYLELVTFPIFGLKSWLLNNTNRIYIFFLHFNHLSQACLYTTVQLIKMSLCTVSGGPWKYCFPDLNINDVFARILPSVFNWRLRLGERPTPPFVKCILYNGRTEKKKKGNTNVCFVVMSVAICLFYSSICINWLVKIWDYQ